MNINEIRTDQPGNGANPNAYFELAGTALESLNGLTYLVIGDDGTGGGGDSGVIESVTSLEGQSIPEDGFFLAAQSGFDASLGTVDFETTFNFEIRDNVTHLIVEDFTGAVGDDLDTDNDGILDSTPWVDIVDSVAIIREMPSDENNENLVYSDTEVGLPRAGALGHFFREPDSNTFRVGAFNALGKANQTDTPGIANDSDGDSGEGEGSVPSTPVFAISTDTNSDGFISDSELNGATTVTATATLASDAQVGDRLVILADGNPLLDRELTAEDIANGVTVEDIAVPPTGTTVTLTSTLENSAGTSAEGTQTLTIGNPPEDTSEDTPKDNESNQSDIFTPSEDGSTLEVTDLEGLSAIRFVLDNVDIDNASEVRIFSGEGETLAQVGAFTILESGKVDSSFLPTLTLDAADGDMLSFELVDQDGNVVNGTASINSEGNGLLRFGNTTLSLLTDDDSDGPSLILEDEDGGDASALDFRGQTEMTNVAFTVFRGAAFDSTVGLYLVDDLSGQVTFGGETFQVGDEGYAEAALARGIGQISSNDDTGTNILSIDNQLFGTYISVENTETDSIETYFSFEAANGDGSDHVKLLGNSAIGFEDLPGLGDADFNDVVVSFEIQPTVAV